MPNTGKFVKAKIALKGGKDKAAYVAECREKGMKAVYSGKEVYEEGELVRTKGFYLSKI
jgi:hypothetical protein